MFNKDITLYDYNDKHSISSCNTKCYINYSNWPSTSIGT